MTTPTSRPPSSPARNPPAARIRRSTGPTSRRSCRCCGAPTPWRKRARSPRCSTFRSRSGTGPPSRWRAPSSRSSTRCAPARHRPSRTPRARCSASRASRRTAPPSGPAVPSRRSWRCSPRAPRAARRYAVRLCPCQGTQHKPHLSLRQISVLLGFTSSYILLANRALFALLRFFRSMLKSF